MKTKAREVEASNPAEDSDQLLGSRLRRLPGDHQADAAALEIVVYQVPQVERND